MSWSDPRNEPRPAITPGNRFLALFGLPAESNPHRLSRFPIITVGTITFTVLVSATAWKDPVLLSQLAFFPSMPMRHSGMNLLSCFLVHADIFHLLSNMYALFVFGDNSEDVLGRGYFVLLLVLATAFASAFSAVLSHHEAIPHLGASGGVFGVIVYYLLRFPRARFTYFFLFHFFQVPALGVLVIYAVTQLYGSFGQLEGVRGIDYLAHVGGGLVGFLFWLAGPKTLPERR